MNNKIKEIELNFANKCGANCMICSKVRGSLNIPLMTEDVFFCALTQLHHVDFETIQTSGNGDAFMNPNFLPWVRRLRGDFPNKKICFYSSFAPMTKERVDRIVREQLFDEVYTRLDSLDPGIISAISQVDGVDVLSNMSYFAEADRRSCKFVIGYSSLPDYYSLCRKVLHKEPLHSVFQPWEIELIKRDEYPDILEYFQGLTLRGPLQVYRINQSLWAERMDPDTPDNPLYPCPKMESNLLNNIIWICPNGDVDACGYDDTQKNLVYGNILQNHMLDLWNGDDRKDMLQRIHHRKITGYPCANPECCVMKGVD